MSVTINIRTLFGFAAGFVIAAIMFFGFQALTADAVGTNESTFVPITPCRLFDTRPGATNIGPRSSPLGEDSSYSFQVTGTNGDCTIPAAATAVSINLTGVSPTAATNLRLYPANAAVPNASVLNMTAGQAPTPNKLDVKLSPDGKLGIYNRFGSIHVVGDVMGYYRHDGIAELEARIAELETLTASMSTVKVDGQSTVRFTGVNVQIVSGSGATAGTLNGKGNLIVGYNENSFDDPHREPQPDRRQTSLVRRLRRLRRWLGQQHQRRLCIGGWRIPELGHRRVLVRVRGLQEQRRWLHGVGVRGRLEQRERPRRVGIRRGRQHRQR